MSEEAARSEVDRMPLQLALGDMGAGVNLDPVVERLNPPGRETP